MGSIMVAQAGQALFQSMSERAPRAEVTRTAIEDFAVPADEAGDIFDALLQWMAALPLKDAGRNYVMLKSEVDRLFHAFILNTVAYREFCDEFFGTYIDHHPVTGDGIREDVVATVGTLVDTYGDSLSPYLDMWARDLGADAWIVSCMQ